MNVFEGSRRVALLVKLLWIVAVVFFMVTMTPSVHLYFATLGPKDDFRRAADDCRIGTDGVEFIDRDFESGKRVSVELCFKAQPAADGSLVVPYSVDETGGWLGNGPYSPLVVRYRDARAQAFVLPASDQQAARTEYDKQWWKNIGNGVLFAVGGWFALSALQFVIGWIVRGFAGIPLRQDRRPAALAIKSERAEVEEVGDGAV